MFRRTVRISYMRTLGALVILAMIITGTPSLAATSQAGSYLDDAQENSPESAAELPEDVSEDWWEAAQEDVRRSEYNITWQEQTYLQDIPAAYQAPNRANNLRTYFVQKKVVVIPRTWHEESELPPWRLEIELEAWSKTDNLTIAPDPEIEIEENEVTYHF